MTNPKHTSSDLVERLRKRREAEMIGGYERIEWEDEDSLEAADRIEALEAENERLREALGLADAALRGANMNMNVVERKLRAALEARHD